MLEESTFGSWLKDRRKVLDLTQDELARRVGCSPMLVRKIEADERRPSKQIAELLSAHLDVPTDERADFVRFARSKNARYSSTEHSPWRTWRHHLTNLPVPPTSLFGREQDIAEIVRRIARDHVRLLTLVGPPGIGKTRLALACADELLDHFDDGVFFVALASVQEPDLVAPTIARALAVTEIAAQSILNSLTQHLADKRILVLLDNFEQVVAAASLVAELLTTSPWLHVLVTSRVSLHVRAERQFRVAPLAVPSLASIDDPKRLLGSPAIQLFVDRALSVEPNFSVSPQNASALAHICAHLDGLPLAIELIATRANMLSPQEVLAQMERRLELAIEGAQDLPLRHHSLRDAIAWSYELLDAATQALFVRLAIFAGGWMTEMAHAVCGQHIADADLARGLSTLADASLVVKEKESDGESRWSMLETIREYAAERLAIGEQTEETARRHAQFFLAFAESAVPYLSGPRQVEWLNRLERDHGNLHSALEWAVQRGEAELALRLGGALDLFWYKQGWLIEGRSWLKRALALPTALTVAPSVRQRAWHSASFLALSHADYAEAEQLAEESYALARDIGDRQAMARTLNVLANVAVDRSDLAQAMSLHEQNLALWRDLGDKVGIASSLNNLGRIAYYRGDVARAIGYNEESLALEREFGDHFGIARTLNNLGGALADNLELDRATTVLQESLTRSREPGVKYFLIPFTLTHLGRVALYAGDLKRAQAILEEGLNIARECQSRTGMAFALLYLAQLALAQNDSAKATAFVCEGLDLQGAFEEKSTGVRYLATMAALFCAQQQTVRTATLIGAVAGLCENAGIRLPPVHVQQHEITISRTRVQLDEQEYRAAFAHGYTMTLAQAYDYALSSVVQVASDERIRRPPPIGKKSSK